MPKKKTQRRRAGDIEKVLQNGKPLVRWMYVFVPLVVIPPATKYSLAFLSASPGTGTITGTWIRVSVGDASMHPEDFLHLMNGTLTIAEVNSTEA